MIISIFGVKEALGIKSAFLNDRQDGKKIKSKIKEELKRKKPDDDTVILDFDQIVFFNSSIADEVIVLFMQEIIKGELPYYLISTNIQSNCLFDIEVMTDFRKVACLVLEKKKKHPNIIYGHNATKMETNQRTIFDLISRLGKATSRELSDLMKKDIYTLSTILNNMFKLKLLRREEKRDSSGKFYIYKPVM